MKDIDEQYLHRIKSIFRQHKLTWDHLSKLNNNKDRSSLRNSLLRWLTKANRMLNLIGYKVEIVPVDPGKELLENLFKSNKLLKESGHRLEIVALPPSQHEQLEDRHDQVSKN